MVNESHKKTHRQTYTLQTHKDNRGNKQNESAQNPVKIGAKIVHNFGYVLRYTPVACHIIASVGVQAARQFYGTRRWPFSFPNSQYVVNMPLPCKHKKVEIYFDNGNYY
jgi:hypothetical protein